MVTGDRIRERGACRIVESYRPASLALRQVGLRHVSIIGLPARADEGQLGGFV